jgi:hypothetical protein
VGSSGAGPTVLGLALVLLGATGATLLGRDAGRPTAVRLLRLAPFGVLVGAGAALVRGWDLGATAVVGAVLVPTVALAGDVLAARRRARGR